MKEIKEMIISKPLDITPSISTIPQILFQYIEGRDEEDKILMGHLGSRIITFNLEELRAMVLFLRPYFEQREIRKGSTVILIALPGSAEIMTAVYFIAMTCMGVRVFMPMQCGEAELASWIAETGAAHAILPTMEINDLEGHDLEKSHLKGYNDVLNEKGVNVMDSVTSFPLYHTLISETFHTIRHGAWEKDLPEVFPSDEAMIVATSGSTGSSRLVVYNHKAFCLGCMAWEQAGLFDDKKMGGSSFTPLVSHTMGVRGIMNALWTGKPACLISPDLFFSDPGTAIDLLIAMNPKVITGGPGVFKIFRDILQYFPEAREKVFSKKKVLVNCGATLDAELEKSLGHHIWNAFGSTETMMVTTTMLDPHAHKGSLGAPLPGVSVKLLEYDREQELYSMHIRSSFGCSRIVGKETMDEYIDTGDLVRMDARGDIIHAGRAKQDMMKDDFGVKIPLPVLQENFSDIIAHSLHTEWFTMNGYPGTCAIVFTNEGDNDAFREMMDNGNMRMMDSVDPLSFAHWHLARIGLIRQSPPMTGKGTVSARRIRQEWNNFIELVRRRDLTSDDVLSSFTDVVAEEHISN